MSAITDLFNPPKIEISAPPVTPIAAPAAEIPEIRKAVGAEDLDALRRAEARKRVARGNLVIDPATASVGTGGGVRV